nr:zinc finger, CCHC-type [Tanacetum cinerariifolium]
MASTFAKLDKFEGVDFKRWQKKMHFLFFIMSVVYVLTTPIPGDGDDAYRGLTQEEGQNVKSSKEPWDSLEAKCMTKDASSKKFLVSNFTNYKMTDSRPVLEQYNELLGILERFTQHKMNMDESIQEELTLVELGNHLRIDESLRAQDSDKPKGNIVAGTQGIECIFVGYAEHSKDFRFYGIEPNKNRLSSVSRPSLRIPNGTKDIGGSVVPEEGFKQKSRIDYFDTYALVARISTIRLLIAMVSIHNMIIHQMDVKTAFLNVDLDKEVDLTKEFLSSRFSMKDLGDAYIILGIRIKHESNGIAISQSHYIEKVIKKLNYFDCTPVSTHIDTSEKMMPNNGQVVSQLEYSRVIGFLMYAMTCTRPDIAFVFGKLSRFTSNHGTQHWQAIQQVLKYLKKTIEYRWIYTGYPLVLEGYTNASCISNIEDKSSTSGWVFMLGGGAISWASKKQTCITGLTMKSKFMALVTVGKEAGWLKNLLFEILLWSKPITPIFIRSDSAATLAKAYSQMYNGKSRHLGVMHNMIRELITNGVISIEFVRSQQNLFDHLTNGLLETWL